MKFSSWFMFIVCDNVLHWLSQAFHNSSHLSWLGIGSERCTGGVDMIVDKIAKNVTNINGQ